MPAYEPAEVDEDDEDAVPSALEVAVQSAGSATALAAAISVSPNAPSMWKKRGSVPAEHCPAIERVTRDRNAEDPSRPIVTCEQLRPDVAWHVLRNQAANDTRPGALDELPAARVGG